MSRASICRRAVSAPSTARGSSGEPGSSFSRVTVSRAADGGATTPTGASRSCGWCRAPTYEVMNSSMSAITPSTSRVARG